MNEKNERTTAADQENNTLYDSLEDIKRCLECEKAECTNCLKYKNGV